MKLLTLTLAFLALSTLAAPAQAEQFGGCNESRTLCAGPAVSVTLGSFNLATNKFAGGIIPGVGYGATYQTDSWYAVGLAGYLAFSIGGGEPNYAMPSFLVSFANYVRVGAGVSIAETGGPVQTQWRLLFALGSDFGGAPKYVRAARMGAAQ